MKDKTFNILTNIIGIGCIICGIIIYCMQSDIESIININAKNFSTFCIIFGTAIEFFSNIYRLTETHERANKEQEK